MATTKTVLESQEKLFRKQSDSSSSAVLPTYRVGFCWLKKANVDEEFVRKYLQYILQKTFPENETLFNTVRLSPATTTRRVEDINDEILTPYSMVQDSI
jgi:hypothetical protein